MLWKIAAFGERSSVAVYKDAGGHRAWMKYATLLSQSSLLMEKCVVHHSRWKSDVRWFIWENWTEFLSYLLPPAHTDLLSHPTSLPRLLCMLRLRMSFPSRSQAANAAQPDQSSACKNQTCSHEPLTVWCQVWCAVSLSRSFGTKSKAMFWWFTVKM